MKKQPKRQLLIVAISEKYTLEAIESVKRNLHKNITKNDVKKVIDTLIKKIQTDHHPNVFSRGELITYVENIATEIRESLNDMDQQIADAILVDFINFTAASQGINYGMKQF